MTYRLRMNELRIEEEEILADGDPLPTARLRGSARESRNRPSPSKPLHAGRPRPLLVDVWKARGQPCNGSTSACPVQPASGRLREAEADEVISTLSETIANHIG